MNSAGGRVEPLPEREETRRGEEPPRLQEQQLFSHDNQHGSSKDADKKARVVRTARGAKPLPEADAQIKLRAARDEDWQTLRRGSEGGGSSWPNVTQHDAHATGP